MNKKDLDALNELYLSVYSPVENGEYLVEGPYDASAIRAAQDAAARAEASRNKKRSQQNTAIQASNARERAAAPAGSSPKQMQQAAIQGMLDRQKARGGPNNGWNKDNLTKAINPKYTPQNIAKAQQAVGIKPAINPNSPRQESPQPQRRIAASTSPAASSTVLAKQKGVEGKLDKATGKFTAGAFSAAEKSRYASVAAQNSARTSASSGSSPSSSTSSAAAKVSPSKPQASEPKLSAMDQWAKANPTLAAAAAEKARIRGTQQTDNPLMKDMKSRLPMNSPSVQSPDIAKLASKPTTLAGNQSLVNNPNAFKAATPGTNSINNKKPTTQMSSYQWPSAKTIRDIADAYASIYEAKKNDGNLANNYPPYDKVTRGDVIAGRLGKDEMGGKKKSTKKEDFEFWINNLLDEGYDLSDYTWDDMYEIYEQQLDEATRMRKELGKEGETRVRGELAARSRAYQRSGSIDRTIAGAEAAADRITPRGRNESPGEYKQRMQKRSRTLRGLAASRRGSVRDKPRAGMRGYAAKVEGPDKELQTARQKAMSAGTLTPKEKKELGEEYQIYEIVASYLLENNFAETINDANVIIENMSEVWLEEILNNN